jgi:hypothetical protein
MALQLREVPAFNGLDFSGRVQRTPVTGRSPLAVGRASFARAQQFHAAFGR